MAEGKTVMYCRGISGHTISETTDEVHIHIIGDQNKNMTLGFQGVGANHFLSCLIPIMEDLHDQRGDKGKPTHKPSVALIADRITESRTSTDGEEVQFKIGSTAGPDVLVTASVNTLIKVTGQLFALQARANQNSAKSVFSHSTAIIEPSSIEILTDEVAGSAGLTIVTNDGVQLIVPLSAQTTESIAAQSALATRMFRTQGGG